jgi:uncharacterized membrane protein YphA (DoxX/SURF4 family)
MTSAIKLFRYLLIILLIAIFLLAGWNKLTPALDQALHKQLVAAFTQYSQAYSKLLGIRIDAVKYLLPVLGVLEGIVAPFLLLIPSTTRLGAMVLVIIMIGASATHIYLADPINTVITTLVLGSLSSLLFLLTPSTKARRAKAD